MHYRFPLLPCLIAAILLSGCAGNKPATSAAKKDYTALRSEKPRSILVVPAVNRSVDVGAPDYLLSTIARPLAERGYYVFPVHLVTAGNIAADGGDRLVYDPANGYRDIYRRVWQRR